MVQRELKRHFAMTETEEVGVVDIVRKTMKTAKLDVTGSQVLHTIASLSTRFKGGKQTLNVLLEEAMKIFKAEINDSTSGMTPLKACIESFSKTAEVLALNPEVKPWESFKLPMSPLLISLANQNLNLTHCLIKSQSYMAYLLKFLETGWVSKQEQL